MIKAHDGELKTGLLLADWQKKEDDGAEFIVQLSEIYR